MEENKLLHVSETSPAAFVMTRNISLDYSLTLVLNKEKAAWLYLSSPGFRSPLPDRIENIETVVQIFFLIFFFNSFKKKNSCL